MQCCYPEECGKYSVSPVLVPVSCQKPCEYPYVCYPCLPACPKPKKEKVMYCCEKVNRPKSPPRDCCHHSKPKSHSKDYCQSSSHKHESRSSDMICCPTCNQPTPVCYQPPCCQPVKTKYIMPCYRYEDGRIVKQLPVTAFKRNGMQDQEHSKLLGTANFLNRCPRDVSVECDVCAVPVKVCDPTRIPKCGNTVGPVFCKKKPKNQPSSLMRRACEVAVGLRPRSKPFIESSYSEDNTHACSRYHAADESGNCCYHFEKKRKEMNPSCCTNANKQPKPSCCPYANVANCYEDCVMARPIC